jgi:N-acetylglucosaminyldiphosphoundecaprenol N-acetyl-beta-D-mannosaminyltransferase
MSEVGREKPEAGRRKRLSVLGVSVDVVDTGEAVRRFARLMETPGCSLIVTPNSEIIWRAAGERELKDIIENADLTVPDGIGIVYASKIMGRPLSERVTGVDLLSGILAWLEKNGKSIYLLGGAPAAEYNRSRERAPDSKSVAALAAEKIIKRYPNLAVTGTRHGYFEAREEEGIVRDINESGADFLCVAMGSPRQEKFIKKYLRDLRVSAAMGVGGSRDIWAGTLKRAPDFFLNNGLEWLYRLYQEPSRIGRVAALPLFMARVLIDEKIMKRG